MAPEAAGPIVAALADAAGLPVGTVDQVLLDLLFPLTVKAEAGAAVPAISGNPDIKRMPSSAEAGALGDLGRAAVTRAATPGKMRGKNQRTVVATVVTPAGSAGAVKVLEKKAMVLEVRAAKAAGAEEAEETSAAGVVTHPPMAVAGEQAEPREPIAPSRLKIVT